MNETTNLEPLIALTHHRWAIPILSELQRDNGAKFVTLVNRLSISRDALSRTLEALSAAGLIARNFGYGHPLRPEYILTPTGKAVGANALELMNLLNELEAAEIALKKWTLPILCAVHHGIKRFSGLREAMPALSPRALTLTVQDLELLGWLERQLGGSYQLTINGEPLAAMLEPLVRRLNMRHSATK
jgi:DNA-binding HxlR family transcriptional regulator